MGTPASNHGRKWIVGICTLVCVHVLLSVFVPRGFFLTAFGDILQNVILCAAAAAFLINVRTTSAKPRLFWALMGFGLSIWLISQVMWTFVEVFLRHEAPNPFFGDVVLFMHVVPMMAAVALQPHVQHEDRVIHAGTLDFGLLLTWWLFLYLFVVIPWQYVQLSEKVYGRSFDLLYFSEELVLAAGLFLVWRRSAGLWKKVYLQLSEPRSLLCRIVHCQ